jgi:hypothetical protein
VWSQFAAEEILLEIPDEGIDFCRSGVNVEVIELCLIGINTYKNVPD